jgi:hypothetical protein
VEPGDSSKNMQKAKNDRRLRLHQPFSLDIRLKPDTMSASAEGVMVKGF